MVTERHGILAATIAAALLGIAALAQTAPVMTALTKLEPHGIVWDTKGALKADVTCDGKEDLVIVGRKRKSVLITVVPSVDQAVPGKPIANEILTGNGGVTGAFCGSRVRISLEARDCLWEDEPIPGCKIVRGCSGFRADDDGCDAFHFYWDNAHKELTYQRL